MKVECPECKAVLEPEWVRGKASGELEVKCSGCGVVSVMGGQAFAPKSSSGAGPVTCPKCAHKQDNPEACDRCGLVFALWDPGRALAQTDEAAEALWTAVDASWDDDGKHRAFLDYCTTMGLYAFAAQQYGRARADGARRTRATAQIERLTLVAHSALEATQPRSARVSIKRIRTILFVISFAVCVVMVVIVASRFL